MKLFFLVQLLCSLLPSESRHITTSLHKNRPIKHKHKASEINTKDGISNVATAASSPLLLMSGDSTMHAQFKSYQTQHTHQLKYSSVQVPEQSKHQQTVRQQTTLHLPLPVQTIFFPTAGGYSGYPRSLPSVHSTCDYLTTFLDNSRSSASTTTSATNKSGHSTATGGSSREVVVYLNFGLLHLLHVHPHRPWIFRNSSRLFEKAYRYADFQGFFNLENWILSELQCLQNIPQVTMMLVQTPHLMCEARLNGPYRDALSPSNISHTIAQCSTYVASNTVLSEHQARELCEAGAFTGENTAKLADRVTDLVTKHFSCALPSSTSFPLARRATTSSTDKSMSISKSKSVCLIDAHLMSSALSNCSEETTDGRHYYGSVLQQEVAELQRFLTAVLLPTRPDSELVS